MPPAADVIGSVTCSKFVFAGMVTELAVARAFTDGGITAHCDGMLSTQAPGRCWTSTGARRR